MSKITLNDQTTGYLSSSAINTNNSIVEDHLNNKVLYRNNPTGEPNQMQNNLDMNFNAFLNVSTDPFDEASLMTVEDGKSLFVELAGDTMQGALSVLPPVEPFNAATKKYVDDQDASVLSDLTIETGQREQEDISLSNRIDAEEAARISQDTDITNAYTSADASLQSQISGGEPLTASAFSEVSWHDQVISNSFNIPANKNAWSFGPAMTIADGQFVTIGDGSTWTIAEGYSETGGEPLSNAVDVYEDTIVSLGGDFDGGEMLKCSRIGNMVSISSTDLLTHSSTSLPTSAVGVIPEIYRPTQNKHNVYSFYLFDNVMCMVTVFLTGSLRISYANFAGEAVARTNSFGAPVITFTL